MIRIGFLLVLFAFGRAQAQSLPGAGLDQERMTAVYTEALAFMAPRILDPVSVPQLTVWGLQGLTTLDPALRIGIRDSHLQLFRQGEIVLEVAAPKDETAGAWARTAAAISAAGLSGVGAAAAGRDARHHPGVFR